MHLYYYNGCGDAWQQPYSRVSMHCIMSNNVSWLQWSKSAKQETNTNECHHRRSIYRMHYLERIASFYMPSMSFESEQWGKKILKSKTFEAKQVESKQCIHHVHSCMYTKSHNDIVYMRYNVVHAWLMRAILSIANDWAKSRWRGHLHWIAS